MMLLFRVQFNTDSENIEMILDLYLNSENNPLVMLSEEDYLGISDLFEDEHLLILSPIMTADNKYIKLKKKIILDV
jgi:hypothetical protein